MSAPLRKQIVEIQAVGRFYDGLCEPYPYEPTTDRFAVIHSEDVGLGLIALQRLAKGDTLFKFYGPTLNHQTLFTLQKAPGIYIEDSLVMGRVLHSCDPNMLCDMTNQTFTALKAIAAGDYLTMDYETTEDELFRSFECQCGSSNCRGHIKGRAI